MKKIIAWLTVIIFSLLYGYASYGEFDALITERNASNSLFGSDKYKFGDLFGMGYYPLIKEEVAQKKRTLPIENPKTDKKINLCLVHDSYLGRSFLKSKQQIHSADTIYDLEYPWFRNRANAAISLDTSKINVLVFEIVERNLFRFDEKTALSIVQLDGINKNSAVNPEATKKKSTLKYWKEIIFSLSVNKSLEFLLFDIRLFTPVKELKSYINYHFFDRTVPQIFVSENQKQLYLSDIKPSIENKITRRETEKTVSTLNKTHDFYKAKGFDHVYFSIIPNPVAIVEPEASRYNGQIPMIQNSPNLKMPIIDIYSDFTKSKTDLYFKSDTHWNQDGFTLWINKLNATLNAD